MRKTFTLLSTSTFFSENLCLEIAKPVHYRQGFKCVSYTAFLKFDHYLGNIKRKTQTSDEEGILYCDFSYANHEEFNLTSEVPLATAADELNACQIVRQAAMIPDLTPVPEYVLSEEIRNLELTP